MMNNKYMNGIVYALVSLAVIFCVVAMLYPDMLAKGLAREADGTAVAMKYESELFDTSEIMEVNIIMDEEQWQDMLANAIAEEYYTCDVEVNGTRVYNVAIRPKGNTSLSTIAMDPDTDRYSLKLEFDRYVDGQTLLGLDKLILNNNYADSTNMKEAIVYDMYRYLGADASLYNYAKVSVNGEYWGVYLALEAVEDSFMLRNYGTQNGTLYKPDTMEMGGGNDDGGFGGFGGFGGGSGASLTYTDDNLDSYSAIWDGALQENTEADYKRVVEALANIDAGTDLGQYMDVDNLLKYMAVHAFVVNEDSFTKSMSHNYYLYESNGQLNIIPWDYNLAFGGMGMGNRSGGSGVVNDPIDTPFSGTEFFDTLMANEEYRAIYHEYLRQLTEEYIDGGEFVSVYNRIREQIAPLVETDPTAFYTYDEYEAGAEMFVTTINLRGESVKGQLDGSVPSTTQGQRENSEALIDASAVDVDVMGTMSMGGFGGGRDSSSEMPEGFGPNFGGEMPSDMSEMFGGEMPEGFSPDFGGEMPSDMSEMFGGNMPGDFTQMFQGGGSVEAGNFPGMPGMGGMQGGSTVLGNLFSYFICFVIAVAALIFAIKYKRK